MNAMLRLLRFAASRNVGAFAIAALLLLPVFFKPVWLLSGSTFSYLFVIDVSESMNVRDVPGGAPDESRLDRAKESAIASLSALPCGSRVAVGLFAGSDTLVLFEPLEVCRHYPAIEGLVHGIDWRMAWDGDSRIEAAVVGALHEAGQRGLDLVFMTDGDEAPHVIVPHMEELLSLQGKVKGWLVGVGGTQAMPVPKLDSENHIVGYWSAVDAVREGFYPNLSEVVKNAASSSELERSGALDEVQEHKSALNADYLKLVGASAGLGYVAAESAHAVASAISDPAIARHEKAERDMRLVFGLASAICVLIGWVRKRGDAITDARRPGKLVPSSSLSPSKASA